MFVLKGFHWGQAGARDCFSVQIKNLVEAGYKALGEVPVVLAESGVPMDMKCVANLFPHALFGSLIGYAELTWMNVVKEKHLERTTLRGRHA